MRLSWFRQFLYLSLGRWPRSEPKWKTRELFNWIGPGSGAWIEELFSTRCPGSWHLPPVSFSALPVPPVTRRPRFRLPSTLLHQPLIILLPSYVHSQLLALWTSRCLKRPAPSLFPFLLDTEGTSLPPPIAPQVPQCNLPEGPVEETRLTPMRAIVTTPPAHGSPFTRLFSSGTAHTQGLVAVHPVLPVKDAGGSQFPTNSLHFTLHTTSKSSSTRDAKFRLPALIFAWVAS